MVSPSSLSLSNITEEPSPTGRSDSSSPRTPDGLLSPSGRLKSSSRLNRWSMARTVRSGRHLASPVHEDPPYPISCSDVNFTNNAGYGSEVLFSPGSTGVSDREHAGGLSPVTVEKSIFMVSDATGSTVEHSINAALFQFEHFLMDRGFSVSTHLFSGVNHVDRLMEIIAHAAKEGAMVAYTLADPSFAESAKEACERWGVQSLDVFGPITDAISSHLVVLPSGFPRWAPGRKKKLDREYFERIEAIEFTIKQDDGALPENIKKADIVLTGVSRSGKTPLSIYLAQKGYKVANVPIVMNVDLPQSLFEVDPEKVFALTINAVVLHKIRRERARNLGFCERVQGSYSDLDYVKQELEYASDIYEENPIWPVIEVTGRAIEETAASVLKVYHERKNKSSMPRISKLY